MTHLTATIKRDNISKKGERTYRAGKTFEINGKPEYEGKFKLYDDDDNLYYSGALTDNCACDMQQKLLDWAMNDAGCTEILVDWNDGFGFHPEIG